MNKNIKIEGFNEKEFEDILGMSDIELKEYCREKLVELGYKEFEEVVYPSYLFAKGTTPVLLLAHLDRENQDEIEKIDKHEIVKNNNIWTHKNQICGDDRCGVYILLKLCKNHHVSVLLTDKEEHSPHGREKFEQSKYIDYIKKEIKYMCQIDRRSGEKNNAEVISHKKDLIYYENRKGCKEPLKFKEYIAALTGYEENYGTMTDIVDITKWTKVSSFNISCGYYGEHNTYEEINIVDMMETYDALDKLLMDINNSQYFRTSSDI